MENALKLYSEIPFRTWNWLGVNEVYLEQHLLKNIEEKNFVILSGEKKDIILFYPKESTRKINFTVQEGGVLNLIKVQLSYDEQIHFDELNITLEKDAHLHATIIEVGGKKAISKFFTHLQGENSKADIAVLYFGDKKRTLDMNYLVRLSGRNTDATLNVGGALMTGSKKIFRGTLDFVRGAKNSVGREKEEVILFSKDVENKSVPLMLSGEDDVDGQHAASIGKVDEDKLFYLLSRGLNLKEAKKLIVEAKLYPILHRIEDRKMQSKIRYHIEGRIKNA